MNMRFFLLLLLLLLSGCASNPQPVAAPGVLFELHGRIAVRYDDHGYYGNLHWVHRLDSDEISILSPLGQTLAYIEENERGAVLTTGDQKRYAAEDAESLTEKVLGWRLPLRGLRHWVIGAAASESAAQKEYGADGKLVKLQQDDWVINYPRYFEQGGMPKEISMQYSNLQIRLVVDSWEKP